MTIETTGPAHETTTSQPPRPAAHDAEEPDGDFPIEGDVGSIDDDTNPTAHDGSRPGSA